MPRPNKKKNSKKTLMQTYEIMNTQEAIISAATDDKELPTEVIEYILDKDGKCYLQQSSDDAGQDLLMTETAANQETEEAPETSDPVLADQEETYQTISLVPSETNEEVSYTLVVQGETEGVINVNVNQTQAEEKENDGVLKYEVEEASEDEVEDAEDGLYGTPIRKERKPTLLQYSCNLCSYKTHRRYLLLRHVNTHSDERPHKCNVCERGFKTVAALQNHVNMHNGIKPHACKQCSSAFTTSGELVRHVRYKHTHEKPHKCPDCDYASVELSKLRRHIRCHTGERPYQCQHCTYASPDMFKLKRHIRTHTGERPYKCELCHMCFTQSNSLKAHRLIHNVSERTSYACELCPAKCGRKADLRIHVQNQHTSDKPLKCRHCGKTFPDRYTYRMHNKTHEGEKFKYFCNFCSYSSTSERYLNFHKLKHSVEKPFICDLCSQSFRQKQKLRRHINLFHNPSFMPKQPKPKTHTCRECERNFVHKGNLIRHMATHDVESEHDERTLNLKIHVEKKAKIMDGEPVGDIRVIDSEEAENILKLGLTNQELEHGKLVTVADGDGQQFVMLEVIQLEDGTELQVAAEPEDMDEAEPEAKKGEEEEEEDEEEEDEEEEEGDEEEEEEVRDRKYVVKVLNDTTQSMKPEKDVDTYFGFDEEEEDLDDVNYTDKLY